MTWFYVINDMLEHCLPSVERAMIPAASHQMEAVNSQAFNEKVLAFFKALDRMRRMGLPLALF